MKPAAALKFFKQVRQEAEKVTWPTRKETVTSTIMVFVMVVLAAIFFFLADQLVSWFVQFVLGMGR
ncbi:MAG: preprotein translocase subunit SecE [Alphaproteobacteria bacterium]|nr:preprotein translocase subunit SecE [Alphaproteobacteria bacterium]